METTLCDLVEIFGYLGCGQINQPVILR